MTEVGIVQRLTREEEPARQSEKMDGVAKLALKDRCTAGNCRSVTPEQVKELYRKLM